ncbi:uncharacterized protein [Nicotiana sylvestris]|uniref:uncharacterized protein n=1 Tax=Nicotiana sylvestris TaxID=4096 RepID=UPI00388CC685
MDPLKYIFQKPMPTGRLAKWQILLTEFDIVYVTCTTMKAQALIDHLVENLVDDEYMPLSTYFPNEEVNSIDEVVLDDNLVWKIYFDGAVNIKGVGIRAILISPIGHHYPATTRLRFFCTNNTIEYEACIMGLKMAIDLDVHELLVMGDSDLLIWQAQGEWETLDIKLIPYRQCVQELSKRFKSIKFREYPEHAKADKKRTIRRLAGGFFLNEEILYKRTPDSNLLRCIDATEVERIMSEVHSGVCGPYMNGYVLVKKILRAGYYWLTMERDCFSFVRKCHQCYGDLIHSSPLKLHPMSSPWPFVAWGMDVIEPIEQKASNGHRFILVAIDYFTKWVEAVTFKAVTKKVVVDFVHSNIICHFGIPMTIITDNAANLNSHLMKEVCEQFKIVHHHSTPYRPKANGVVEAANKNIKKILRKMIQGSRKWHKKLPFALLGYCTTVRTSVGATPYLLVYGTETVIPAEVEIPSLRIIVESKIEDNEWVKTRLEQLMLINEKRLEAVWFVQLYQQRMARAYNKKVRPRHFEASPQSTGYDYRNLQFQLSSEGRS